MRIWFIRLLGGMVCAVAALALAMGVAHAEEKKEGLKVEPKVNIKLPEIKPELKVKRPEVKIRLGNKSSKPAARKPAIRVKARVNVGSRPAARKPAIRVKARVNVGSRPAARKPAIRVKARVNVGTKPRSTAVRKARESVAPKARKAVRSASRPAVKAKVDLKVRKRTTTVKADVEVRKVVKVKAKVKLGEKAHRGPGTGIKADIDAKLGGKDSPLSPIKADIDLNIKKKTTTLDTDVKVGKLAKVDADLKLGEKAHRGPGTGIKADIDAKLGGKDSPRHRSRPTST